MSGAGATGMRALVAAVATISLLAGTGQTGVMAAPSTAAPIRPNLIFILTDDLDAKSIRTMPQLNTLLVNQGVSFASFFVTTSLCCPSRSSILRGEYVHNHQVFTNQPPSGGFERFHTLGHEDSTVAVWLKTAGIAPP